MLTEEIADGVSFTSIYDDKFKTERVSVSFFVPLRKETATPYALLPLVGRKGCRTYPDMTTLVRKLLSLYGADLDADVRKIGEYQAVTFHLSFLSDKYTVNGESIKDDAVNLLRCIIFDPVLGGDGFIDNMIVNEKQFLKDAIKAEINSKRSYAINQMGRKMFKGEPYSISRYGNLENVDKITGKSLYEAYLQLIQTAKVNIIYTGSSTHDDYKAYFVKAFADMDRRYERLPAVKIKRRVDVVREYTEEMDIAQGKLVMGFRVGSGGVAAMRMLCTILGGTPYSKLFRNVREKKSLCYYCSTHYDRFKRILIIDSGIEHTMKNTVQKAILKELSDAKNGRITKSELAAARTSLINSYRAVTDNAEAIEGFTLGQLVSGKKQTPADVMQEIEGVTPQDIVTAAHELTLDTVYYLTTGQS